MKKFCPNCGKSVRSGAVFCPNCGAKLNSSQVKPIQPQPKVTSSTQPSIPQIQPKTTQSRQMHRNQMRTSKPRKLMTKKNKIIFATVVVVVVMCVTILTVVYHIKSNRIKNNTSSVTTHATIHTHKVKKRTKSTGQSNTSQQNQDDSYSNNEWMLMGYMAYAYKNYDVSNDSELVAAVQDNLSNGNLEVNKNSNSSYTLTNKYGSVDVDVNSDSVEVSNDGNISTAKLKLKKKFSSYKDQIKKMATYIKNDSSEENGDN